MRMARQLKFPSGLPAQTVSVARGMCGAFEAGPSDGTCQETLPVFSGCLVSPAHWLRNASPASHATPGRSGTYLADGKRNSPLLYHKSVGCKHETAPARKGVGCLALPAVAWMVGG